jgi:hypothetical protein
LVRAGVFKEAAKERWNDANCLHQAERFDGAIYLCGYVLECFLKFVFCARTRQQSLGAEGSSEEWARPRPVVGSNGIEKAAVSEDGPLAGIPIHQQPVVNRTSICRKEEGPKEFGNLFARYTGLASMARDAIKIIETALEKAFDAKGAEVYVAAEKSDYKDFIRMFVVSDYFRGMAEKRRLDEVYSMLESSAAGSLIEKISLCVTMTKKEYLDLFEGEGWVFVGSPAGVYREMKPRPRVRRLARSRNRA